MAISPKNRRAARPRISQRREKKEKKEKRANSKASPKLGSAGDKALVVPAGVETHAKAAAGTAAGGGGRWVHLPS